MSSSRFRRCPDAPGKFRQKLPAGVQFRRAFHLPGFGRSDFDCGDSLDRRHPTSNHRLSHQIATDSQAVLTSGNLLTAARPAA